MAKAGQYTTGVDGVKGRFGAMFTAVDEPAFANAFCKIYIDQSNGLAAVQKMDGVGSKSVQRYLHAMVTGDFSVFGGDADDLLVMNGGDASCSGLLNYWVFTDVIAINQLYLDKRKYIKAFNKRMGELKEMYREQGIPFSFWGGETADLIHQCDTIIMDACLTARTKPENVITGDLVVPGDTIIGARSGGPCNFEEEPNSGHMSNASTGLRLGLMHPDYENKFPEIGCVRGDRYTGKYHIGDEPTGLGMEISEALMSPTRHFPFIIKALISKYGVDQDGIHGFVLCTGGGTTKCNVLGSRINYVKDTMPEPDPLFKLYQSETGTPWKKMHESANVGIGLDVIADDSLSDGIISTIKECSGVESFKIGRCERSPDDKNHAILETQYGTWEFDQED
jgi:phosphoribosylformylglycinamidine cyclo-ligase